MNTPYRLGIAVSTSGTSSLAGLRAIGSSIRSTGDNAARSRGGVSGFMGTLRSLGSTSVNVDGAVRGMGATLGTVTRFAGTAALALGAVATAAAAVAAPAIKANAELESQQNALASIISLNLEFRNSQGKVLDEQGSFNAALGMSNRILEQDREMAKTAPGSSKDLMEIFTTSLNSSLQAGATVERVQQLGYRWLGVAKIMNVDVATAARDLDQMLMGAAGAQDTPLFKKLGLGARMTTEEFNKLSAAARLDVLEKAAKALATDSAMRRYSRSWEGLTSTLEDFKDTAMLAFGKPIFDKAKQLLGGLTDLLDANQAQINAFATLFGTGVVNGFNLLVQGGQTVVGFLRGTLEPVVSFFVETFGGAIQLLQDSGSLGTALEGWKAIGGVLLFSVKGLLQLTAAAAGFIALGLGTVLTGIGVAANAVATGANTVYQAWQKAGGGVQGVFTVLGQAAEGAGFLIKDAFNSAVSSVGAAFDRLWTGFQDVLKSMLVAFIDWGLELTRQAKSIPVLGSLLGAINDATGIESKLEAVKRGLNSSLDARLSQTPTGQGGGTVQTAAPVNVTVSQQITTSDPQAAANAANRGVARAVTTATNGKTGAPLTANPLAGR